MYKLSFSIIAGIFLLNTVHVQGIINAEYVLKNPHLAKALHEYFNATHEHRFFTK